VGQAGACFFFTWGHRHGIRGSGLTVRYLVSTWLPHLNQTLDRWNSEKIYQAGFVKRASSLQLLISTDTRSSPLLLFAFSLLWLSFITVRLSVQQTPFENLHMHTPSWWDKLAAVPENITRVQVIHQWLEDRLPLLLIASRPHCVVWWYSR